MKPPLDVLGHEIEEGDRIAYPTGAGSDGSHLVVGVVDEVKDGTDRWGKPCRVLMVKVTHTSGRLPSVARTRIWMTRKSIIIEKGTA